WRCRRDALSLAPDTGTRDGHARGPVRRFGSAARTAGRSCGWRESHQTTPVPFGASDAADQRTPQCRWIGDFEGSLVGGGRQGDSRGAAAKPQRRSVGDAYIGLVTAGATARSESETVGLGSPQQPIHLALLGEAAALAARQLRPFAAIHGRAHRVGGQPEVPLLANG